MPFLRKATDQCAQAPSPTLRGREWCGRISGRLCFAENDGGRMGNTRTQGERALVAWAVLGDTVKSTDLYEGLFGFVRPIADSRAGARFIPAELCDALRDAYGLNMPVLVMESLSERLHQAGILAVHTRTRDGAVYTYAKGKAPEPNLVTQVAIAEILSRFKAFMRERGTEFAQRTDAELDQEFFERLMHIDSLALLSRRDNAEALKRTEKTISLKRSAGETVERDVQAERGAQLNEHFDYLFATFLLHVRDSSPEVFDLLCEVAGANLVAESLLTYKDPPKKGEALQGLDVYLDAPLCMDILGVNIGREGYGAELAKSLISCGAQLCVFLHSVSEIERVLEARRLSYLQATAIGPSVYSVEPPLVRDRVRAIVGHVEQALVDRLNCRIVDAAVSVPSAIRARVGAAEEAAIRTSLSGWTSAEGREVDVASVCDLIRLRSNRDLPTRLATAGPTLVTRNSLLKRTANDAWRGWLVQTQRATSDRIRRLAPLAIADRHLAGLIWITQGGSIGEVSRELLVANCSAATALRRDVVVRVHNTLVQTSPEDAKLFAAVILDQRAERALMDATFGDLRLVNDDSVLELLETVRKATAAEVVAEKDLEIKQVTSDRLRVEAELTARNRELAQIKEDIDRDKKREEEVARAAHLWAQNTTRDCFSKACSAYRWAGAGVGLILTGVIVIAQLWLPGALKDAPAGSIASWFGNAWWIPTGLFALSTLLGLYEMPDLVFGSARSKFSDWVFHLLLRRRGIAPASLGADWDYRQKMIVFKQDEFLPKALPLNSTQSL